MQGMVIAQFAAAASKQYLASYVERATVRNQEKIEKGEASAANRIRVASNLFEANKANYARFLQSTDNNRRLDAMGEALEANLVNARRQDDAIIRSSFEDALRASEEMGGAAAAQAWSGLTSSVVDQVNSSTALRRARAKQDAESTRGLMRYDAGRRASQMVSQGLRGLDGDIIMSTLDYNTNIAREFGKIHPYMDALRAGVSAVLGQGENFAAERRPGEQYRFNVGQTQGSSMIRLGSADMNNGPRLGMNATTDSFWGNVRFGESYGGGGPYSLTGSSESSGSIFGSGDSTFSLGSARLGGGD